MIPRQVPLEDVAESLGRTVATLVRLSRRGCFPKLYRVDRLHWNVRLDDVTRWLDEVEESPAKSRLQAEILRRAARAAV